jgi:uncharacterized protein (DUF2062 family)
MPFRRRVPLSWSDRVLNWLWPRIGLGRVFRLYWHRLHRLPGTPHAIAAGFSLGVGFSLNPFLGTHIVLSVLAARLTRVSMVGAALGTLVMNPWTAPAIWFSTYYVGRLIEGGKRPGPRTPGFGAMFKHLSESLWTLDSHLFMESVWPVIRPMLLGSILLGVLAGLTTFALIKPALERLRGKRKQPLKATTPEPASEPESH